MKKAPLMVACASMFSIATAAAQPASTCERRIALATISLQEIIPQLSQMAMAISDWDDVGFARAEARAFRHWLDADAIVFAAREDQCAQVRIAELQKQLDDLGQLSAAISIVRAGRHLGPPTGGRTETPR